LSQILKAPSDEIIREVELPISKVYLLKHNIIKIVPFENAEMGVDDLIQIQAVKRDFIGDEYYGVMFVAPTMGMMTKEARELASQELINKNAIVKAIVLNNLGMRLIASFFLKFNKPVKEHRIFDNETEAFLWLEEKIKGSGLVK